MTAHTGIDQPFQLESDIRPGWNMLAVSEVSFDPAGRMQPAVTVAESLFVVVSSSPATYHHHGDLLSTFDFSNPSSSYFVPKVPVQQSCITETSFDSEVNQPDVMTGVPIYARAVFEMIAQLGNRTIVSIGDSNERNIIRDVHSICKHLNGSLACMQIPLLAEPARSLHVFWPAINFTWILICVPGVSTQPHTMFVPPFIFIDFFDAIVAPAGIAVGPTRVQF